MTSMYTTGIYDPPVPRPPRFCCVGDQIFDSPTQGTVRNIARPGRGAFQHHFLPGLLECRGIAEEATRRVQEVGEFQADHT